MFSINKKKEYQEKLIKLKEQQQLLIQKNNTIIKEKMRFATLMNSVHLKPITNLNSKIPLNIFTCWHTLDLPPKMKENIERIKKENPEFNVNIYDNKMCLEFIKNNFDDNVAIAYQMLKPDAYKSDLWRYCILYIYGGIYIDIKLKPINEFKFNYLTDNEYFIKDLISTNIWNGLIVTLPKNKILLDCIKKIVYNIRNRFYGEGPLDPTGPGLLGSFFNEYDKNNLELSLEKFEFPENEIKIGLPIGISNKKQLILIYYKEYREEQKEIQQFEHYSSLWEKQDIYYNFSQWPSI